MRILFFIGHDGFIRNFEPVLHSLVERGHSVHLALTSRRAVLMSAAPSLDALCDELPGLSWGKAPKGRDHRLASLEDTLMGARDYLRFLAPEYEHAHKLRARAERFAPPWLVRLLRLPVVRNPLFIRLVDRVLRGMQRLLPTSPELRALLQEESPDVVLFTPLIKFGSRQAPAVRAARRLGIPTALLVHSWDNLTNKGVLHEIPDQIVVWNEEQRREAVEMHGAPPAAVVVTGAQSYDEWFERRPASSRAEFCARVGLDPDRRLVLYVGSSAFVAPDEPSFVARWLAGVRAHLVLREAGVILRPHPQNRAGWERLHLERGRAVIWPPLDGALAGRDARDEYFDSIHHAAAVVGINTSALLESAIQERPVLTVRTPEFRDTQDGTVHFSYLVGSPANGLLTVGSNLEEHFEQLASKLAGSGTPSEPAQRFVQRFLRPHGTGEPSTPRVIAAIEALAGQPPTTAREPAEHGVVTA